MTPVYAFRHIRTNVVVVFITLGIALLSLIGYELMQSLQYILLIAGTIFIGIPHGATDNHIFSRTHVFKWLPRGNTSWFYALYVFIAAFYGLLWYIFPIFSLLFFLLISIYHFGQSHLFYLPGKHFSPLRILHYLTWGSYALFLPLMFHYPQAQSIIEQITGASAPGFVMVQEMAIPSAVTLLAINILFWVSYTFTGKLSLYQLFMEIINLLALGILAYLAPLFVAFITYWALWHSYNSVLEISTFISGAKRLKLSHFYKKALPLSLISFAGIGLIFYLTQSLAATNQTIAVFFIIIAAITLPHSLLMDLLYKQKT